MSPAFACLLLIAAVLCLLAAGAIQACRIRDLRDQRFFANTELGAALTALRAAERMLAAMPEAPPILFGNERLSGSAHLVVWKALTAPESEILVSSPDHPAAEAALEEVLSLLKPETIARGRSGVTKRPGNIRLANGSRILFRIPQKDNSGIKGCRPDLVWWIPTGGAIAPEILFRMLPQVPSVV